MSVPLQATRKKIRAPRLAALPECYAIAGKDWPLVILRHPRARRISLRVRAPSPRFSLPQIALTLPKRAAMAQALTFLQANTVWLARELARHAQSEPVTDGIAIEILGERLTFRHTGRLRGLALREEDTVWISGPPERFGARLEQFLSRHFEHFAQATATALAERLGVTLGQVYAKRMQARWGSCSPRGDIALNWRLVLAPRAVAEYVIAHEVAHRREMNHSADFWLHVRTLMPEFPQHREWLKREGHRLYQWQV